MIVQIENTLFVTPDDGCEICEATGAVWIDRDVYAAEECGCITRQLDDHQPAFSHYEVIAENANASSRKPYAAMKLLEKAHDEIEQREHNRVVSFLYKTTK